MGKETDAFTEVYKAYYEEVFKSVYHRIANRQIAEDITQDTFFVAFRLGEAFLRHPEPKLWLLRTARYKMLEAYRKAKRWGLEPLEKHQELQAQDCYYGEVELNLAAMATLGKEEWRAIKAYHVFGNTISEMAESEAVTENNMRVRLFRVRKKLRDGMKCWIF